MRGMLLALAFGLTACATAAPINRPLGGLQTDVRGRAPVGEDLIILALSGGGARAASFHLGVLRGMRETPGRDGRPLTEHIALITSVSGGSVLAAYYAQHGEAGLDTFEAAYLARDWRVRRGRSPASWAGMMRGGMNGPAQLADWLDANVYDGARMSALGAGPRVIINATDLYNSTPFAFTQFFFDGLCSNLTDVRVADAVAASMAAPVAFRPILMESYAARCEGPPAWTTNVLADRAQSENVRQAARAFQNYRGDTRAGQRYVHLSDGGVADNFGLLSLQLLREAEGPPSPLTPTELMQARRVLLLVVNAEYIRPRTFQREGSDAIGAYEMMYAPVDVATEVSKRALIDVWRAGLPAFERELRDYRCRLPTDMRSESWRCDDISVAMDVITFRDMAPGEYEALFDTATDVSLPRTGVAAIIL
ncbi:MAG TPA: patatin-like phospholipase family protein, partial [Candidatus Binatia bacterium]|nr:patatin-like phospholipase family protein [Candidatus Binatia bacterium]